MKKVVIVSLLLAVFALIFPMAISLARPLSPDSVSDPSTPSPAPSTSPDRLPEASYVYKDEDVFVRVSIGGSISSISMSQYLTGVVGAEMPASFGLEALKAQAVAARTETLYHMFYYQSKNHPDADTCSDPACCQAYKTDLELREKWGNDYDLYIEKILEAVHSTDGICITYDNMPIQAVFHSSSSGQTAASGEVWENSLPYLVSVKSPETAKEVPNYISSVAISLSDFKETVLKHYPDAVFPKDQSKWITDIIYTDSGRIKALKLGGVTVAGPSLRTIFGLRSTAASVDITGNNITFTTTGYGHGVGMSQYGAKIFAEQGKSYKEILTWYYTGVSFSEEQQFTKT